MKQLFFFLSVFCFINPFFSQTLSPEVISPAGSSFTDGTNSLSWTLGEPVTSTVTNSNVLTQGFQQDNIVITSMDEAEISGEISIFPNPAVEIINVQFNKPQDKTTIELYTIDGKLVLNRMLYSETLSSIDMSGYATGTYILKIKNKNTKSFQIVKSK